jgi:hypothetical protein
VEEEMSTLTYVYKTNNTDYEEVFENGIVFFDQKFDFDKVFKKVDNLTEYLKDINSKEMVYIVEIPESYLITNKNDKGKRVTPYPILSERDMFDPENGIMDVFPVLVPTLVAAAYSKETGRIVNGDYTTKYNPCGLKFSRGQLIRIKGEMNEEYDFLSERNNETDISKLYSEEMNPDKEEKTRRNVLGQELMIAKKKNSDAKVINELTSKINDVRVWRWSSLLLFHGIRDAKLPFPKKGELKDIKFETKKEKKLKPKKGKKNKRPRYEEY